MPKIVLGIVSLLLSSNSFAQSIFTVAGGGTDDGRPATAASLDPFGLAVDRSGNLYIADYINSRIRKVSASTGVITTVAGIGTRGFFGDGGPATAASLDLPTGVALDSSGNLYVADAWNHRIRKVSAATSIITTVAGIGTFGFFGDGGPATAAALRYPWGVALDGSGNLYIADSSNHRIRKVTAATGIITTVAGAGTQGFSGDGGPGTAASLSNPEGVALDGSGDLYIADRDNHRIRKVAAATGIITTVAGSGAGGFFGDGGLATAASLNGPSSVALDISGNLYIADHRNHRIRKVTAATGIITTAAGSGFGGFFGDGGPPTAASLPFPRGVALDSSGNLYIADRENSRIRKVTAATGIITTVAGSGDPAFSGDGGPATAASLNDPEAVALDGSGNLYIADRNFSNRIRKVTAATGIITTVAGKDTQGFSGDGGPATAASLFLPGGVALDGSGNLYIADSFNHRIRKVTAATGIITTVAGSGAGGFSGDGGPATAAALSHPEAVALDGSGDLYIADLDNHRIRKVTAATGIITTAAGSGAGGFSGDGGPATAAALFLPSGVALDSSGNLYIADRRNHRIRKVTAATGIITTVAGTGTQGFSGDGGPATAASLNVPIGLALDSSGNLYIADLFNHRIRKVTVATGIITTVAGSGAPAFSGDGGPATAAALNQPSGVTLDSSGNLHIADSFNHRIRAVFACVTVGPPSLLAPADRTQNVGSSPNLSWSSVPGAFRYDLFLDASSPPVRTIAADLSSTSYTPSNLLPATEYFWKVVAKGDPFCPSLSTSSSTVRSFTTATVCTAPSLFSLTTPVDGAVDAGSSLQLSWQAAPGASTYDLFLGPSSPPPFFVRTSETRFTATALVPSTTYYWNVIAHAACDPTKTTSTPVRSFKVAGACAEAGSFRQLSPAASAENVPGTATLEWSASANASSYDLHLGTASSPPLYLLDLTKTSLQISGLSPGATYYWQVVAKVACDPSKRVPTSVSRFTISGTCETPRPSTITFVPPGNVGVSQTYVVAWADAPGLDTEGSYLIERSLDPSFSRIVDSQRTLSTYASFVSPSAGTYYHRVRPIPRCDTNKPGPYSAAKSVNVVAATPNVIFTVQPQAVITALREKLEDRKATFALENISSEPVPLILGGAQPIHFFQVVDPFGGDPILFTLEPRKPKTFEIHFSGPPNDQSNAYQGIIFGTALGKPLAITPYAFVSLKVGGRETTAPSFVVGGIPSEYAFFLGFSGADDANRQPISIVIQNRGTTPMELGVEIGPELWLIPEEGWNASEIPPNASRGVRLFTRRSLAPNGSALPRYTYFTVRTKTGQTARLLVQDNDLATQGPGRLAALEPGVRSIIIPDVVSATSARGRPLVSTLRLSNVGSDSVQAELLFTPTNADGFDPGAVRRATIVCPPNDVVTLTDPLVQIFDLAPPSSGQIEIRVAPEKLGLLAVTSSVSTTIGEGGSFGHVVPTIARGEGATVRAAHAVSGLTAGTEQRTTLILAETSGIDKASVRAVLYDKEGNQKGDSSVEVPRYGRRQFDNVGSLLGGGNILDAARIELTVESGGGSVIGVVTILDRTTDGGATLVSQPIVGTASATAYVHSQTARTRRTSLQPYLTWAAAAGLRSFLIPSVVNGPLAANQTQSYQTTVGFTAISKAVTFTVTYRDSQQGTTSSNTVTVPARQSVEYGNVLEQLFQLAAGARSQGSIFVEAEPEGQLYARIGSVDPSSKAIISQVIPVIPTDSETLSGGGSQRPVYFDGLEQSIDPTRGSRWLLILNEVRGRPVVANVRLYEAGNRSAPIAEKDFALAPLGQLKLDTVFSFLDLDTDERKKDRTNILCVVAAKSGEGLVSAVAVSIDNRTGESKSFVLSPAAGPAPTIEKVILTAVPPSRRRPVRRGD